MKITSIDGANSDAKQLTLRTEPPLTEALFHHWPFVLREQRHPELGDLSFSNMNNCLVVRASAGLTLDVTKSMTDAIEKVLEGLEKAEEQSQLYARNQKEAEEEQDETTVNTAAQMFGVPVK